MPPRLRQKTPPKDEVEIRWAALSLDQRQALMSFDDPTIVESIKVSLQSLYEKQALMHQMGIRLPGAAHDQFAASSLFTSAFTLSWHIGRSRNDPSLMLVDPTLLPVLVMKCAFLEKADFVEALRQVLPDFLSPVGGAAASMLRMPLPKARWKDIFAKEPSSVALLEQMLVRLVEQALWAMALDPAFEAQSDGGVPAAAADLDAWWIEEEERERKKSEAKKKQKKSKKKLSVPLQPTVPEEEGPTEEAEAETARGGAVAADAEDAVSSSGMAASSTAGTSTDRYLQEGSEPPQEDEEEEEVEPEYADSPHADDSVGTGVLHMADMAVSGAASDASRHHTAASTPVADFGMAARGFPRCSGQRTPPDQSPAMRHAPPSSQLICYIWNQTSQFDESLDHLPLRKPPAPTQTPDTVSSTPNVSSRPSTAVSRGSWTPAAGAAGSPSISVVVKNTFVDIEGPYDGEAGGDNRSSMRSTRSMSPSILRHMDNEWRYW